MRRSAVRNPWERFGANLKPRISPLTPQRSRVHARMSPLIAASVIGRLFECGGGQAGADDVNTRGSPRGPSARCLVPWGDFLGLASKAEAAVDDRECFTIR